jgi:hypothetical protein
MADEDNILNFLREKFARLDERLDMLEGDIRIPEGRHVRHQRNAPAARHETRRAARRAAQALSADQHKPSIVYIRRMAKT